MRVSKFERRLLIVGTAALAVAALLRAHTLDQVQDIDEQYSALQKFSTEPVPAPYTKEEQVQLFEVLNLWSTMHNESNK